MPTENEELIPIKRDISVLITLDTYQGMTDEEIQSVIDYYVERALVNYKNSGDKTEIETTMAIQRELFTDIATQSQSMLQSVLNQSIPWATVASDGTVIQNV